jgi:MFS transporter, SHS family, lactate transporter
MGGTPPVISPEQRANSRNALIASFLGWTLDAFDFFILTYVLTQVGEDFHKSVAEMSLTLVASLMMRPVGAVIFGLMADRWGRKLPLMIDVIFYSMVEVLSGFARGYSVFFVLRLLYGIGMGGEWGVGASLAMEAAPVKWRGILSGILQEGYALGNLLAAIAFWTVYPHWGWRPMFFIGGLPALLTLFIRAKVKESGAWQAHAATRRTWGEYFALVAKNWKRFVYLVMLLVVMNFMSHGTQDLYPTLLQKQHHFSPRDTAIVSVIAMIGAMVGGVVIGLLSDRFGRRRAMIAANVIGFAILPLWAFAPTMALIAMGAFLMQFMVQGAWGVIPIHINELSPGPLRGFFPGFAYQLGVLFAAEVSTLEALMTKHYSYAQAMGLLAGIGFVACVFVIGLGPEAHRVSFESVDAGTASEATAATPVSLT